MALGLQDIIVKLHTWIHVVKKSLENEGIWVKPLGK